MAHSQRCAERLRREERRPAFAQRHDVVLAADGQQLAIAPEIRSPRVERLAGEELRNALQIVAHEQRLAALGADVVQSPRFVFAMAEGALEILDVHSAPVPGRRDDSGHCSFIESYQTTGASAQRMPTMLSASALLVIGVVAIQAVTDTAEFSDNHLVYALRLIGALLIATLVPLLIDLRARRSSRVRQ